MNKIVKNSILVIIILVVLSGIIYLGYDILKTEPVDGNLVNTNLADENTGLDNLINDIFENVAVNQQEENVNTNTNANVTNMVNDTSKKNEESKPNVPKPSQTNETVTSKAEKAVELVKTEWGGSEGVYFTNESIDSQGRYIVSVRDKGTTNSLAFFIVDVNTGLVTKQ